MAKEMSFMMRQMVKSFVPMIKENIGGADDFIKKILAEKQLMEHEECAVVVLAENPQDGKVYVMIVGLNASEQITRVIEKMTVVDLIEKILKQL